MPSTKAKAKPRKRRWLTIAQIAERFGINRKTVTTWIKSGELRYRNASESADSKRPRYRVHVKWLRAFWKSREFGGHASAGNAKRPSVAKARRAAIGESAFDPVTGKLKPDVWRVPK